jgi:hypothetical protein
MKVFPPPKSIADPDQSTSERSPNAILCPKSFLHVATFKGEIENENRTLKTN